MRRKKGARARTAQAPAMKEMSSARLNDVKMPTQTRREAREYGRAVAMRRAVASRKMTIAQARRTPSTEEVLGGEWEAAQAG